MFFTTLAKSLSVISEAARYENVWIYGGIHPRV
jgi:hypothetical protein